MRLGTKKERGLLTWRQHLDSNNINIEEDNEEEIVYNIPGMSFNEELKLLLIIVCNLGAEWFSRFNFLRYVPVCPSFRKPPNQKIRNVNGTKYTTTEINGV